MITGKSAMNMDLGKGVKFNFSAAIVLLCSLCLMAGVKNASGATLVHDFYLPMPETQIRSAFTSLNAGTIGTTLDSVFSVVVTGAGTVIYYDQWEDGYEVDLLNPVQSTTQIWGDGNNANGKPPGYANDPASFTAGTVLTLRNNVSLPRNPSTILFDARDRVAATKALVVSRAAWALTPGPVLAGAVEVTATIDYGTSFICPVGEDIGVRRFDYVGFLIMAEQNGTTVTIDTDGSGPTGAFAVVLNRGESYQVNGGVKKGGSISASKRVEVQVMTGRKNASYGTSWFTLYPTEQWSNSYITPVGTANNNSATLVYLYNPGGAGITINYVTRVSSGSVSVAANGVTEFQVPKNSGASFTSAGGENFFALSNVGASPSSDVTYDWGFSLLPVNGLTSEAVVGWGPGSSDGTKNGSPVWLTTPVATRVYVDYNGDHLGAQTDPKGNKYDVHYDLVALQSQTIYDPDKDQTAMRLYTLNGAPICAAWGQDPGVAGAGNPYLDLGTTVLPFPIPAIRKSGAIFTDNGDPGLTVGDVLEYTIQVDNKGLLPLGNVVTLDSPPPALSYVAGSTTLNGDPIPDGATGTLFPIDEGGYTIPLILRAGTSVFKYRATIVSPGQINNTASTDGNSVTSESIIYVQPPSGATIGDVEFTTVGGVPVSAINTGDLIYVTLADTDANTNATTAQTITLVVKNTTNADLETITLTETGINTGVFRNTVGLSTSLTAGLLQEDGTLNVAPANSISVTYNDPYFFDTDTATITVQTPSLTKLLYLSDTLALDRIDPVAALDGTTAQTALIAADGITLDAVSTSSAEATTFTSVTVNHTTGAGHNRLMMVGISYEDDSTAGMNITSVTYAGNPLTLLGGTNASSEARVRVYYLVNPPSGASSVTVNVTGTDGADSMVVGVATFFGVDQATPFGTAVVARGASTSASMNVTTVAGDLVFDTIAIDDARTANLGAGQTGLWERRTETGTDGIRSRASTEPATGTSVTMSYDSFNTSDDWAYLAVPIKRAISTNQVTFVQTAAFLQNFSMPLGGAVSVTAAVTIAGGTMPANPNITAYLKYGTTTFATLSSPTYAANTITWNGTLGANVTIPSGQAVSLVVSNTQTGVLYRLEYDSMTKPSKIALPTTTVIKVQSVGLYDGPYPGGSTVNAAANGSTVYLRAAVTDPFGSADITSLDYTIDGPGTASDLSGTLTGGNVVADDGFTKTYEYVWNTGVTIGGYSATVVAHEGTEGTVTDSMATAITLNFLDTGTLSRVEFTSTANGAVATTFAANSTVFVRVTDVDQNADPLVAETLDVVFTSASGDTETVTMTETGVNTGVFTASLVTSTTLGGTVEDGTLLAPLGSVLTLTYTDPDDASDTSSASAIIPNTLPSVAVNHTLVFPADGTAVIGESIQFQVQVVNNGNTTLNTVVLTDTFPAGSMSFDLASIAPSSTAPAGTLTWNNVGPLSPGAATNITVTFTATASAAPATVTAAINADSGAATDGDNATVTITRPQLTITQTELIPGTGNANIGDNVVFRVVIENTGDTTITSLPLEYIFSAAYYSFVSATVAPDGSGGSGLFWVDLGPLTVGSTTTVDITLTVIGGTPTGAPAINTVYADYATDTNGDAVAVVAGASSAGVTAFAAKISGSVYNDVDLSGTFTAGDVALINVTLELYTDPNGDGNPADGVLLDAAVTDAAGYYEFLNLDIGKYVVVETDPDGLDSISPVNNRIAVDAVALVDYTNNDFFDALDTVAPAVPSVPDLIAGSDTGGSSTDNITDDSTPTFTGTAEPGSTVKLYSDFPAPGTLIGTGVADASGVYTITASPALADGTHHITATATDLVGNVSVASGALTVVIDTTPPAAVISSISGDTGSSGTDFITKDNTLVFSGTTSAGAAVTLTLTDSAMGTVFTTTVTADASGNWTYDYSGTPLADDDYTLVADSGSTDTQAITVDTVDQTGPVTSNTLRTEDTTPTITGTATVGAGETFTVTVNGVTYTVGDGNLMIDGGGNWSLTIPPGNALPPSTGNAGFNGEYIVTATITDTAGNTLTTTSVLTVTVFPTITPATGGGSISADNFTSGTYVTLTGPIYEEGTAGDIGLGTIILTAPAGFEFATGGPAPTVLVTGSATAADNINDVATGSSLALTAATTSQLTFTVTAESAVANTLTWQNVRVRPTAGTPLATGDITVAVASTSTLTDVTAGTTSLGALAEVPGALSGYKITLASPSIAGGGTDQLTIVLVDQYGNPLTGFSGDVALTFSGPATSAGGNAPTVTDKNGTPVNVGSPTTITFVNGQSTAGGLLTGYKAESSTVGASDGTYSTSTTGGSGAALTVTVGAANAYRIVAASGTPTAGSTDALTITQVDQYGNTITGLTGDVALTFSGLAAAPTGEVATVTDKDGDPIDQGNATTITFTAGVGTVGGSLVPYAAETATLHVSDGTRTSAATGGTGAALVVSSGTGNAYRLSAASGTPAAGANDVLTIRQVDQYGNTVTGLNGDVALTFSGLGTSTGGNVPTVTDKTGTAINLGTATTITFTAGVGTAGGTLVAYKAETATLDVTDGTRSSTDTGGTSASLTVSGGTASGYRITAATTTPTAGASDVLTIRQVDQYGNTVTGLNGDVALTFSGLATATSGSIPTVTDKTGSAINEGTATTITFTAGVGTAGGTLVAYKAETATLGATDGTRSTASPGGSGATLTVSGATASRLGFATQPDKVEINTVFPQQPVVQTQDIYGNPSATGLGASLDVTLTLTAGSGVLSGTVTLDIGTGAGNGTVTYTDLQLDTAGPGRQLTATATGLTDGLSSLFDVWTVYMTTGDVIVADRGPYFSTGTILISKLADPTTAVLITSIKDPYEVAREADGNFLVVDYETRKGGGLFRINRLTFAVTTVSIGGNFDVPFGVKVETKAPNAGQILVADLDAFSQAGAVFRVDPVTGVQTTLTQGTNFYFLQGLAIAPTGTPNDGDIYVTSVGDGAAITSKLIKIDPGTGAQTVLTAGGNLNYPVGMAVEASGNILVVDALAKKIIRVTPAGVQTVLSDAATGAQGTPFLLPTHVALDAAGDLYVSDGKVNAGVNERLLFKVDKTTGNRTLITQDGFFEQPRGLLLIP